MPLLKNIVHSRDEAPVPQNVKHVKPRKQEVALNTCLRSQSLVNMPLRNNRVPFLTANGCFSVGTQNRRRMMS